VRHAVSKEIEGETKTVAGWAIRTWGVGGGFVCFWGGKWGGGATVWHRLKRRGGVGGSAPRASIRVRGGGQGQRGRRMNSWGKKKLTTTINAGKRGRGKVIGCVTKGEVSGRAHNRNRKRGTGGVSKKK